MHIETNDFAVQIRADGQGLWRWSVIADDGEVASQGQHQLEGQARREALLVAGSLSRFRQVTGGW